MPPHNLTLTLTGAGLLWVRMVRLQRRSALAATGFATSAFVATSHWRGGRGAGMGVRGNG